MPDEKKTPVDMKTGKRGHKRDLKMKSDYKLGRIEKTYDEKRPYIGPNDIAWRSTNDVLNRSAATLPFGFPIGLAMQSDESTSDDSKIVIPGILLVYSQITMGTATDNNSPANMAGRQIYAINRRYNSGSKNYDISDVTILVAAMQQCYACLGWLQRLYHTLMMFSDVNRYQPRAIIKAQNVDYDDLMKHQAEMAYLIAWFGNALQSINMPNLPILKASYEAFMWYYVDDESPKHQLYIHCPFNFGQYDPTADNGGAVDYTNGFAIADSDTPLTFQNCYDMVHGLMDVILSDSDIGLISGDIAKAWGDNLFKLESVVGKDVVTPKYSLEFLQQVHNLQLSAHILEQYSQNPGTEQTGPYVVGVYRARWGTGSHPTYRAVKIDAYSGEPKPEEIINTFVLQVNYNPDYTYPMHDLFVPIAVSIVQNATTPYVVTFNYTSFCQGSAAPSLTNSFLYELAALTNFDWHPMIWCYSAGNNNTDHRKTYLFGDVRNLNLFKYEVAQNVHTNSMLALVKFTSNVQ